VSERVKRGSMRKKIIAWSFFPTVIILVAVALVNFYSYQRVTEDLVVQRNRELGRLLASRLSAELSDFTLQLERYTGSIQTGDRITSLPPMAPEEINRLSSTFDGGLVVLDWKGTIISAFPTGSRQIGSTWPDPHLLDQLLVRNRFNSVVSGIIPAGVHGEDAIALAVPIVDPSSRFNGALVGIFHLYPDQRNEFFDAITRLRLEGRGTAYIVDGNGRVIYHTQVEEIGQSYSSREEVRQVLGGMVGSTRTRTEDGTDVVLSYAPVLGTHWGMVIQESWSALTGSTLSARIFLILLLALGIIVPAVFVTLGVRRITRPIADLTLAAQEVAGGKFGRTIYAPTGDEVEELAEQFNRMSVQLQESYMLLEQRVADRTRELETLNSIAAVVSRSLDLQEILGGALKTTMQAMEMEAGAVLIQDDEGLALEVQDGLSVDFQAAVAHLPLGSGASGQAAVTSQPVVRRPEHYREQDLQEAILQERLQLVVSVPLISKSRVLGVLNLCTRQKRDVTAEELAMLASVGSQVGVAIENARLFEQAEQTAIVSERNRLARDLHDAVTQTLFSASLIAEVLPRIWNKNPEEGIKRLAELGQLNRGALAEMRTLLLELRPSALVEAEINELFRHLVDAFTARARIPVSFTSEGDSQLPTETKIVLYRIAQETLNNIAKHSAASQVAISMVRKPGFVSLTICDNGRGFDPGKVSSEHLGLSIMRERAEGIGADLMISSQPEQGSQVKFTWTAAEELENP
jgi:nitrate/nitrite-specific signal transduction histidine kinase